MAANDKNQVSVALRLTLDQLKSDIQKAAASMKSGLAGGTKGIAADTDKATSSMDKLEKQVKKTTNAFKDQKKAALEAWRNSLPEPKVTISGQALPGYKPTSGNPFQAIADAARGQYGLATNPQTMLGNAIKQATDNGKYRGYGMADLKARGFMGNPVLPGGTIPQFKKPETNGNPLTSGGMTSPLAIAAQIGATLAGFRVAIGLTMFALREIISPLQRFAEVARQAGNNYARALQSGVGIGFTTYRSSLAKVMGVGENEVMRFGLAVNYLSKDLAASNKIIMENTRILTESSWKFGIMKNDIAALSSALATKFSYAINSAIDYIDNLAKHAGKLVQDSNKENANLNNLKKWVSQGSLSEAGGKDWTLQRFSKAMGNEHFDEKAVADRLAGMSTKALEAVVKNSKNFMPNGMKPYELQQLKEAQAAMKNVGAPSPMSSANRMVASAWERMGLVIGGGSIGNFSKETAKNTKETVSILKQIAGAGIARSGMAVFSPQQAQP